MAQCLVPRHPWRHSAPLLHHAQLRAPAARLNLARSATTATSSHAAHTRATTLSAPSAAAFPLQARSSRILLTTASTLSHTRLQHRLRSGLRPFRRLLSSVEATPKSPASHDLRKNKVDVQMLHPELQKRVFPMHPSAAGAVNNAMEPTSEMVKCAIEHLEKQNLWGKEAIPAPHTSFDVPPLRGKTIEDHFYNLGVHDSAAYKDLAVTFAKSPVFAPPKEWVMREGWTRYGKDGSVQSVPWPKEQMLTFDVETVPALSRFPVMACALSSEAWYGWVSPWLINPLTKDGRQNDQHLLTLGPSERKPGQEKILVGHNVGYDRARILEEYSMEQNSIRYLDTMSLHIAVSGLCTQQRPGWLKYSKAIESENAAYIHATKDTTGKYFDVSAVNSLLQVSKFHCGIQMEKAPREILMEARELGTIQEHFQALMAYCGQDVAATHSVYQKTLPKYLETCPHPVSFAGMLQMGSSFLTVNEGWIDYVARCNKLYQEMAENVESKLMLLAENALENFQKDPAFYQEDPWLSQLDWQLPARVWKEGVPLKSGKGWRKGQEPRWSCRAKLLPEKPEWYRGLWDSESKRIKLSTRQRVAPLLLKLQWRGFPLVHSSAHGWAFRVPMDDQSFETKAAPLKFPAQDEAGYQANIDPEQFRYYRLPHKSGEGVNVGNPLAKGYIPYFEENVLSSFAVEGESSSDGSGQLARQALDMNAQCAYWVSAKERIEDQFVVWDKGLDGLGDRMGLPDRGEGRSNGMILPQIITMGTVTRRAVEKTWMTASNAKKNRIGSELKSMVQAPAGYKIVGADVDSEELWISSLMGDAQFRMHGATALGWMTLQGTKAAGTDLHSKTAQILGISRDQAKVFNYGRIYGAGLKFAIRLLQQFNSTIEAADAKKRATSLYTATKGTKEQKAVDYELVYDRPFWHGGSESYMFNSLERTATADDPRTPALGCGITDALKPKHTENQFMTSRVNWVVQSSGVDYLHLLLVSMNYLIKRYDIKARFMLCVHDEVRYMVKEEDAARATLALQVSNLWTRALFSYRLGIHDLPQSVAFFSSVDVDHVFRKEVNMDCLTPTQRTPIPHGQSLTIEDVLPLTGGGHFGAEAQGFCDAAEDSLPMELRPKEEQRKMQQMQSTASGSATWTETTQKADEEHLVFLEAQAMATLKEIKQNLKRRKSVADAAWKAKQDAEKAASKRSAAAAAATTGATSGDGGKGGLGGKTAATGLKKSDKPVKRHVRDAKSPFGSRSKAVVGHWGKKNAALDPVKSDQQSSPGGKRSAAAGVPPLEPSDEIVDESRRPVLENTYEGAVGYDASDNDDVEDMGPTGDYAPFSTSLDRFSAYYADVPLSPRHAATSGGYSGGM